MSTTSSGRLVLDGSHGEGGGQIVRTALALAASTGRPLRIERIRAGRARPGLAAQHLATARALASVCGAQLVGDALGSSCLEFTPAHTSRAGAYDVDIGAARPGGSAGATTLVLQAMVHALMAAEGESTLVLRGGTHVAWSPMFEYVHDVWMPTLVEMGTHVDAELRRHGFYPASGGELRATVTGVSPTGIASLDRRERGPLRRVAGTVISSRIPRHVRDRMIAQARTRLAGELGAVDFESKDVDAACPGVALFISAHYASSRAGFGVLGERGKPAERVADEAVAALLAFHRSSAAIDEHLADQLLVPAALANGPSELAVQRVTSHLTTNAWVIEQLGVARVTMTARDEGAPLVAIHPR
ncbi:MAG: 3-terminal phosphate cyclase [Labilithrix sp.]|nr:3-terminal phosphate cyclase [Labilithrix sp.]